jgi:hypothetical protein
MNHQTDIDNLIKNMLKEDGLEKPSNGFTDKVMHTIMEADAKPVSYKPLIPKYVLVGIFSGVVLFILFLFSSNLKQAGNSSTYFDKVLNSFQVFQFNLEIPAQFSYIITSALILFMIQAALIGTIYKKIHR